MKLKVPSSARLGHGHAVASATSSTAGLQSTTRGASSVPTHSECSFRGSVPARDSGSLRQGCERSTRRPMFLNLASASSLCSQVADGQALVLDRILDLQGFNGELCQLEEARLRHLQKRRSQLVSRGHSAPHSTNSTRVDDDRRAPKSKPTQGGPVCQANGPADALDALRTRRTASAQRIALAKQAISQQSAALQEHQARCRDRQATVNAHWQDIHREHSTTCSPIEFGSASDQRASSASMTFGPGSPRNSDSDNDMAVWVSLEEEWSELQSEREHIRQVAATAEHRMREALKLSRNQAKRWEDEVAAEKNSEARQQLELQESWEAEARASALRLRQTELEEQDHVAQATQLAQQYVRSAVETARHDVLLWEVRAAEVRNGVTASLDEAREHAAALDYAGEMELEEIEVEMMAKLRTEAFKARDSWKDVQEAEAERDLSTELRATEEDTAQREAKFNQSCEHLYEKSMAKMESVSAEQLGQIKEHMETTRQMGITKLREDFNESESKCIAEIDRDEDVPWVWITQKASEVAVNQAMAAELRASLQGCRERVMEQAMSNIFFSLKHDLGKLQVAESASRTHGDFSALGQAMQQFDSEAVLAEALSEARRQKDASERSLKGALMQAEASCDTARAAASAQAGNSSVLQTKIAKTHTETEHLRRELAALQQTRKEITEKLQSSTTDNTGQVLDDSLELGLPFQKLSVAKDLNLSVGLTTAASHTVLDSVSLSSVSHTGIDLFGPASQRIGNQCQRPTQTTSFLSEDAGLDAQSFSMHQNSQELSLPCAETEECKFDIPSVYEAALATVERVGWQALHPDGEAPTWTVFHWAASEDRADICRRLLTCRADPYCQDDQGRSVLDCALDSGVGDAWRLLNKNAKHLAPHPEYRASNPDANLPPHGTKPLPQVYKSALSAIERFGWCAVHHGEPEWTVLHWAASEGRSDLCAKLLLCKANPELADNHGRKALEYARESGNMQTISVLANYPRHPIRDIDCARASKEHPAGYVNGCLGSSRNDASNDKDACTYPMSLQMSTRQVVGDL